MAVHEIANLENRIKIITIQTNDIVCVAANYSHVNVMSLITNGRLPINSAAVPVVAIGPIIVTAFTCAIDNTYSNAVHVTVKL